jgi:hypothetical protein
VGPVPHLVAAGDLNRDRIDDLVVADAAGGAVLLANPDSTFRPQMRFALDPVTRMEIARVNDDFNLDLVVLVADLPAVRVYPGRGDGTCRPADRAPPGPQGERARRARPRRRRPCGRRGVGRGGGVGLALVSERVSTIRSPFRSRMRRPIWSLPTWTPTACRSC